MLIVLVLVSALGGIYSSSEPSLRRVVHITAYGRLVEGFSSTFLSNLGGDIRARLATQYTQDKLNDDHTPRSNDHLSERTPFGSITLGPRIHKGAYSTVFAINEFPNWVIKYQAHCNNLDTEIHPLLRDAWYTNVSHAVGLSPGVHFVSPPSGLCIERSGKCAFNLLDEEFDDCSDSHGPLRYMIMDRFNGKSLHHLRRDAGEDGAMPLRDSVAIGAELIKLLRQLHTEAGIAHGDIHSPNVMIEQTSATGEFRLGLVDFGLAFNISNVTFSEMPICSLGHWFHPSCTQWQIDGFAWSPRDDVLKAIQTIAHLMHPFTYFAMEKEIKDEGYRALREWKIYGNWFVTSTHNPIALLGIEDSHKERISALLDRLLLIGRKMQINQRPPYEEMIEILVECFQLSTPVLTTKISAS